MPKAAAAAFGVYLKTVEKWIARFCTEGIVSLRRRSSSPHKLRHPNSGMRHSTDRSLAAPAMDRLADRHRTRHLFVHRQSHSPLPPAEQDQGYRTPPTAVSLRAQQTGEMITSHQEVGVLQGLLASGHRMVTGMHRSGGAGWKYLHVCIDDRSRAAFFAVMPDETARSAIAFSQAAVAYYQNFGITIERVMTDNGPCYSPKVFRNLCTDLDIRHIRNRLYTPRINGKAERFMQTAIREWAYVAAYQTSTQRCDQLPGWLHRYNWQRPHTGIKEQSPISRLGLNGDNLLNFHT